MEILEGEIWKLLTNISRLHWISNYGRIWSVRWNRLLKPSYENKRYATIGILGTTYLLHRLVAETFIPNPENKPQVNHIDGDKHNNYSINLEWVTPSENQQHCVDMGLRINKSGKESNTLVLTKEQVEYCRENFSRKKAGRVLAKELGVSQPTVSSAIRGDSYYWIAPTGRETEETLLKQSKFYKDMWELYD